MSRESGLIDEARGALLRGDQERVLKLLDDILVGLESRLNIIEERIIILEKNQKNPIL